MTGVTVTVMTMKGRAFVFAVDSSARVTQNETFLTVRDNANKPDMMFPIENVEYVQMEHIPPMQAGSDA